MKLKIRESRIDKTKLLNQAICAAAKPPGVFVSLSGVGGCIFNYAHIFYLQWVFKKTFMNYLHWNPMVYLRRAAVKMKAGHIISYFSGIVHVKSSQYLGESDKGLSHIIQYQPFIMLFYVKSSQYLAESGKGLAHFIWHQPVINVILHLSCAIECHIQPTVYFDMWLFLTNINLSLTKS